VSGSNDHLAVLGDFRHGFRVVDRVGVTVLGEPLVKGANRRPIGTADFFAYRRVGARITNANAARMLRL